MKTLKSIYGSSGLAGKNVLVTGASSGIGQAISLRLMEAGFHIIGLGRSQKDLAQTAKLSEDTPGSFSAYTADLAQAGAMEAAVAHTIKQLGSIAS